MSNVSTPEAPDRTHATDSPSPVAPPHSAFTLLQFRLITLLLHHDQHRFKHLFGLHPDFAHQPLTAALRPYRDLAVLFYLRDELFEHILPRIVAHLSFAMPSTLVIEESPSVGGIDWERTLSATWNEQPGETPMRLYTRQRQRSFATPENLLTVATLLEYRERVQHLFWHPGGIPASAMLHHTLTDIIERCDHELTLPQFAGLCETAQNLIADEHGTTSLLANQVQEHLLPGHNSAYVELLTWRTRLHSLPLLHPHRVIHADDALGADPQHQDTLYQVWLFYELLDMLHEQGHLESVDTTPVAMHLRFRWGDGSTERTYELRYNQTLPNPATGWSSATPTDGQHRPTETANQLYPIFYLWRIAPSLHHTQHNGTRFWREPGMLWAAHYRYDHGDTPLSTAPVMQMIANLNMAGERYGALLYAEAGTAQPQSLHTTPAMRLTSNPPWQEIALWHLQPPQSVDTSHVRALLTALLDDAHARLHQPRVPTCHGLFLDTLNTTAHGVLATATNLIQRSTTASTALHDLLICPKPHINPWHVDIVSLEHDCCRNPAVCHILHLPDARKPRRLTTLHDVTTAFHPLADQMPDQSSEQDESQSTDEYGDTAVHMATSQVVTNVKYYVDLLQPDIERYYHWIRDRLDIEDLFETTPLLTDTQRETMALGRFLWEQIEHIGTRNFAGPVLLFCGILEELTRSTIYLYTPDLLDRFGKPLMKGLGALGKSKDFGGNNWVILKRAIVYPGRWNKHIARYQTMTFSRWINHVKVIAGIRNRAAHRAYVSPEEFDELAGLFFGSVQRGFGVFNGLLLAWRPPAEHA